MMNYLTRFVRFIFRNIGKIFLVVLMSLVFLFVLFPFGDLNDLVSSMVSSATRGNVYVQFDDLRVNPITTSLGISNLVVETPKIPGLKVNELEIAPSILALAQKKAGGSLNAQGIFKGEVSVSISPHSEGDGPPKSKIEVSANSLSVSELRELARMPLPITGQLDLNSEGIIDLNPLLNSDPNDNTPYDQPEVDVNIVINRFELPSTTVNTGIMGNLDVPEVKFGKVEIKGKLINGKLQIENGKLGGSKDDLYGDIKGEMGLSFVKAGGQLLPQFGAYSFSIDLKANTAFQQRAGLMLSFLDQYKTSGGPTASYKLKIAGDAFGLPPQLTPIR